MQNKKEVNYENSYTSLTASVTTSIEGYLNEKKVTGKNLENRIALIPNADRKRACQILWAVMKTLETPTTINYKENFSILSGAVYREYLKINKSYKTTTALTGRTSENSTLAAGLLSCLKSDPDLIRGIKILTAYKVFLKANIKTFFKNGSNYIDTFDVKSELLELITKTSNLEKQEVNEIDTSNIAPSNVVKKNSSGSSSTNVTNNEDGSSNSTQNTTSTTTSATSLLLSSIPNPNLIDLDDVSSANTKETGLNTTNQIIKPEPENDKNIVPSSESNNSSVVALGIFKPDSEPGSSSKKKKKKKTTHKDKEESGKDTDEINNDTDETDKNKDIITTPGL